MAHDVRRITHSLRLLHPGPCHTMPDKVPAGTEAPSTCCHSSVNRRCGVAWSGELGAVTPTASGFMRRERRLARLIRRRQSIEVPPAAATFAR
jgi:hypothetical protein